MANKKKVFSKAEWLKSANADLAAGVLTEREIADACAIWVDALDGKTKSRGTKSPRAAA